MSKSARAGDDGPFSRTSRHHDQRSLDAHVVGNEIRDQPRRCAQLGGKRPSKSSREPNRQFS
jgi:hypothetical protein